MCSGPFFLILILYVRPPSSFLKNCNVQSRKIEIRWHDEFCTVHWNVRINNLCSVCRITPLIKQYVQKVSSTFRSVFFYLLINFPVWDETQSPLIGWNSLWILLKAQAFRILSVVLLEGIFGDDISSYLLALPSTVSRGYSNSKGGSIIKWTASVKLDNICQY